MKILSIRALQPGDIKVTVRNTQNQQNIRAIVEELAKQPAGVKELVIHMDGVKKFERYALQKALQKAGAHVRVFSGTSVKDSKPVFVIRRMTDAEWKEYVKS